MTLEKILVVSDLHVGSQYALMPQKFGGYEASKLQRKILSEWVKMCRTEKDVDSLFIVGDVTDGTEEANSGKELWTSDINKQLEAAEELVKMVDYDKVAVVYGTPYHTQSNLNADEDFAKRINAQAHGWELSIRPHKEEEGTIHVSHQISVSASTWQYRTTPLAKELMLALLNEKELYKYRCIIRAHAHYYCYVAFSSQFGWINPCWQTRTPYMIRKGLSMVPKLGYIVLYTPEDMEWDIDVHTFNLPKPDLVMM